MRGERIDWFEVVSKIEAGDRAALLRLTHLVASLMMQWGAYRSRDGHEDLVQEITLSLIQSVRREVIRDRGRFVAYAWVVVRNRLINDGHWRLLREGRDTRCDPEELAQEGLDPARTAPELCSDPRVRLDLERALTALPLNERMVIEAIYLHGRSYVEVSEQLEVPLGTVKRRQWRGLRSLRKRMGLSGDLA